MNEKEQITVERIAISTEEYQQDIINTIKEELKKKDMRCMRPSSYYHSVWLRPLTGRFLFADRYVYYEVIEPLIDNKTLIFKGVENHQGEKMLRYVLA